MARILATASVALLLVAGGLWLAERQRNPDFPVAQRVSETEPDKSEEPAGAAFASLDGYAPVAPLSDAPQQHFAEPEQVLEEGYDYRALLETNKGTMVLELYQDATPVTVNNFVFLALHRYYDGVVFHRVLEDFMAQTGDPSGTGRGGPGYQFADEIAPELTHDEKGVLSMANAGPNTNGSQFFITFQATPWLDGRHTIFGRVIEGLDVLDRLQRIDPQSPQAVARLDDSLAELRERGIALEGDGETTLEQHLIEQLGALPAQGQTFTLGDYTAVLGSVAGAPAVGFFPRPDYIETLTIYAKPLEE
jgi:cyclophilin family peptidyl-prolyl cis-trans isomerase